MEVFTPIIQWVESSKYILIFLGCIFEGPVVMLTSGFLYRMGTFEFVPMYIALVSGDLFADIVWYCIGRFGARNMLYKYGHRFGITQTNIEKIQHRFQKYHDNILIISKLTTGFGFAIVVLVVAGISHIPFKKYVTINLFGGFVWTTLLLIIGYFFGGIYESIGGTAKFTFAVLGIATFILVLKLGNDYLSKLEI